MLFNPSSRWSCLFFVLLGVLINGCGTVPIREVEIVPAPIRNFPMPKNAIVRMPVMITFADKGGLAQPIVDLFKSGTLKLIPYVDSIPGFKSHLKDLWKQMQIPIFIDKDVWLSIHPIAMGIGRMRTDPAKSRTAHSILEMVARPELSFGKEPPTVSTVMPPLMTYESGPITFSATSNARLSYQEANDYIKDPKLKIIGTVIPGTGQKLTITGIRFYGSGGQVIVEVKLKYNPPILKLSDKPGELTLYLRGTPHYLSRERVFDFPDLDFDIKTNDFLAKAAGWILKSDILKKLREVSQLPIGVKTDQLKARLNVVLNRPIAKLGRLDTKVETFKVFGGYADNEGVVARVTVRGTALMEINWK